MSSLSAQITLAAESEPQSVTQSVTQSAPLAAPQSVLQTTSAIEPSLDCRPLIGHCDYYSCLSKNLGCGDQGYLLDFGQRYCEEFINKSNQFTQEAQSFLRGVRECLQVQLESVNAQRSLHCESVKELAAEHHITCYQSNNYCSLPESDKDLIVSTVMWSVIFSESLRSAALDIEASCR